MTGKCAANSAEPSIAEVKEPKDLNDEKFTVGIVTGSATETFAPKLLPRAKLKQFSSVIFINRLKTYEKTFADANIDLMKIQGEIFSFAHKQFMSSRQNIALQLIFEELVFTLLLRRHKDIFPMEMKILYDETSEDWEFKIQYGGENQNPLDDKQDVSVKIVEGIIKSAKHEFTGKNLLTLR